MLSIRPNMCAERNWCWNARPIYLLLYLDRRRLKERIHGRPRSDRKKRFLLSAVAPSTSSRHPRKARPINWAQRGGLASGGKLSLLTPRPHFTASSRTLGHQVVGASDGAPFCRERRPTRVRRTPAAGSGLLAEASTQSWVIVSLGGDRIVEHRQVPRRLAPTAHCPTPSPSTLLLYAA
jgi:hypothetical protein